MSEKLELLTNDEMAAADKEAEKAGVPSLTLMENAGRAVADQAIGLIAGPKAPLTILCGPGNNGGDGFVAARYLKKRGHDVHVGFDGEISALKGDAKKMAERWEGSITPCKSAPIDSSGLIIDAIFGAGLKRPIEPTSSWGVIIDAVNSHSAPVLAVDVPSGLNGTTGQADGAVVKATRTITFFRRKPGHGLFPGRQLCGETIVADIGIPETVLETLATDNRRQQTWVNAPSLWRKHLPSAATTGHKYDRGHTVVVSGPAHKTGAARLGARGALRIGSGLVTVASPKDAIATNAAHLTAIMLDPYDSVDGLRDILADTRKNAVLIGPGSGIGNETRQMVEQALKSQAAAVLDADALTSFRDNPTPTFLRACHDRSDIPVVMTPHQGEFARLFPDLKTDKLSSARARAANRSRCDHRF